MCIKLKPYAPTDYFADNGFAKPVSTLQHPNAEYFNGVTYMAYQGPHKDPYVCAYDHNSGQWSGPFIQHSFGLM